MAAQRFPEDWDGILAGAPALAWTRQLATFAWLQHAFRTMPPDAALRVFREGPRDPESGEQLYFGFAADPDSDSELQLTFAEQFFRNMVHDDPAWRIERFAGVRDFELAQQRRIGNATLSQVLDAVDPDLSAFARLRGKLLMYFGWADTLISPHAGVDYYERVVARMGSIERTTRILPAVHGTGHGALPGWGSTARVRAGRRGAGHARRRRARHPPRAGSVGGARSRAGANRRSGTGTASV